MHANGGPKFTLGQHLALALVPPVVWALLWIFGRTWRFEVIGEPGARPVPGGGKAGPEIYCFWHQCVLPCAMYFRNSGAVILISQSFDGELITRILRRFGFDAVRGSSSRGASGGLLGMRRVIESGRTAIFTADGPRGPIYKAKPGPIKLAQITGAPIGAFHLQPEKAWVMNSWDRFLVPKPFTKIVVSWVRCLEVPPGLPAVEADGRLRDLNDAIERARERALERLGQMNLKPDREPDR